MATVAALSSVLWLLTQQGGRFAVGVLVTLEGSDWFSSLARNCKNEKLTRYKSLLPSAASPSECACFWSLSTESWCLQIVVFIICLEFRVIISEIVHMIEIYLSINRSVFDLKLTFTEFLISFTVFF